MKDYSAKLERLEHLDSLVEQYVPLMYGSSEEGRRLHKEICEVYGEVEDVYGEIVGRQRIDVPNGGGPGSSMYPNFFEAGFLSGRSIHTHQGRTELLKVIGQVRRRSTVPQATVRTHGNRVFLVHGHDEGALNSCARFIEKLGLSVTILREQPNQGRTIIEKFVDHADVGFAVVLLTPETIVEVPRQRRARVNCFAHDRTSSSSSASSSVGLAGSVYVRCMRMASKSRLTITALPSCPSIRGWRGALS